MKDKIIEKEIVKKNERGIRMKKVNMYCKFIKDIYDEKILVWRKNKEYLITFKNEDNYYFGNPLKKGISKENENKLYKIIERTEWN